MKAIRAPWTALPLAVLIAVLLLAPAAAVAADQAAIAAAAIAQIMETFSRPPVDNGAAVGIAVEIFLASLSSSSSLASKT